MTESSNTPETALYCRRMPSFDRHPEPITAPSPWVMRWSHLIHAGGTVLDLAAGHGRHTRALRSLGFRIVAADIDVTGLADLAGGREVEVRAVDLETGAWPFERIFDAIVITNYLHRPHAPHIVKALAPHGVLLFDTFGLGNERLGRPRNPDFLLKPGELLQMFAGLNVVAYECGEETQPRPAVRQRLCAVNGIGPYRLEP